VRQMQRQRLWLRTYERADPVLRLPWSDGNIPRRNQCFGRSCRFLHIRLSDLPRLCNQSDHRGGLTITKNGWQRAMRAPATLVDEITSIVGSSRVPQIFALFVPSPTTVCRMSNPVAANGLDEHSFAAGFKGLAKGVDSSPGRTVNRHSLLSL